MVTISRMQEVVNFCDLNGLEKTIDKYNLSEESINRYYRGVRRSASTETDQSCIIDLNDQSGKGAIITKSSEVKTVENALAYAQIDLDIWEPKRNKINFWDVSMKLPNGTSKTIRNYQITVWVERKKQNFVENSFQAILQEIKKKSPAIKTIKKTEKSNPILVDISIFDQHLGKLCVSEETGTSWTTEIATSSYIYACLELLKKAQKVYGKNIEKIIFPLGQDFFHIDDSRGTTPIGNNKLDVDGSLPQIFKAGYEALKYCIIEAAKVAPVEIIYSPGNHDFSTSYFLCEVLNAYFYNNENVTVDINPEARKAILYGINFIGFAHWGKNSVTNLPLIFSTHPVYGEMWGKARYREIQTGHFHKKEEFSFMPVSSDAGVIVRRIPSLTGTDMWHYTKGFVNNTRMAECYFYDKNIGPAGSFPSLLV